MSSDKNSSDSDIEIHSDELKLDKAIKSILEPSIEYENKQNSSTNYSFEDFVDERSLISRDIFGKKEMKIKILEISDERQPTPSRWKFGSRVKVNKLLITIKHLDTQEIEEGEFDVEKIENELIEKRHYTSTNRWVHVNDIKNGYVLNSRHTLLISDAHALDYISF